MNDPTLVHPGQIFVIDTPPPGGAGTPDLSSKFSASW
jgi:hypothetical protein